MYIRYVNKLCDLHLECDNFTEAAHTLRLHSQLLQWSDASLPPLLRSPRHITCHTHRQLKEALYYDIINYFDKGKVSSDTIFFFSVIPINLICTVIQYFNLIFEFSRLDNLVSV